MFDFDALKRTTDTARAAVADVLRPGDIAVDATCGNGQDTVFLAQTVGETGKVYAFDVQPRAVETARARTAGLGVDYFLTGHENFMNTPLACAAGRVKAVMYNLGYLPGAPHTLTTCAETTLASLRQALTLLAPGGIITLCVYAHAAGRAEGAALDAFCQELTGPYNAYRLRRLNRAGAPYLIIITKDRQEENHA